MEKRPFPKRCSLIHPFICCMCYYYIPGSMKCALNAYFGSQCLLHPSLLRRTSFQNMQMAVDQVAQGQHLLLAQTTMRVQRRGTFYWMYQRKQKSRVHVTWAKARTCGSPAGAHLWGLLGALCTPRKRELSQVELERILLTFHAISNNSLPGYWGKLPKSYGLLTSWVPWAMLAFCSASSPLLP